MFQRSASNFAIFYIGENPLIYFLCNFALCTSEAKIFAQKRKQKQKSWFLLFEKFIKF